MRRATICLATALLAFTLLLVVLAPAAAHSRAPQAPDAPEQGVVEIPIIDEATVDAECAEYGADALTDTITYPDGSTATIYMQHDSSNLYVCMEAPQGSFDERFGSVYLDPQGDGAGYTWAQEDDYGFWVNIPGTTRRSMRGNGSPNGWTMDASLDGIWDGQAATSEAGDVVEWRIETFSELDIGICDIFGVAVYHHWFAAVGDDHGWPSSQYFDQPRTWQSARIGTAETCNDPGNGHIAYVYRGDAADATSFYNLLTGAGYLVDLVPLSDVATTNFSVYDLIIIADDSGHLDAWGTPGQTANQVAAITAPDPDVPVIGLGEGGYAFFGRLNLFIGWPNGWHGPEDESQEVASTPGGYFDGAGPVHRLYAEPVNEVGIYLGGANDPLPPDVTVFGIEPPSPDHANLILQGCRHLWGFSGNPLEMTANGQGTFLNAIAYMISFQCPPDQPPPEECVSIEKVASPSDGTPVAPGDTISYTINYLWSDDTNCRTAGQWTRLIDFVPFDSFYVPGSASGGVTPGADGALVWPVAPGSGQQKADFQVEVADSACFNEQAIANQARLLLPGGGAEVSNVVTHPVECPDIIFPNEEPPYAESEIQINPYPLVTNRPSTISVKVTNLGTSPKQVVVRFQTSPNRFGIGLNFNTFYSDVVTIPASSSVIVKGVLTPSAPGHGCIQIVVQGTDPGDQPIKTQKNIDVVEELEGGVPDELDFKVGNPTAMVADVHLTVINTCPGWTAVVSPTVLPNMGPSEIRDATLTVTPPSPVTLGSGCHIDVQGWIDGNLIGGLRKIDVPPVHLPVDVEPPYMEQEISVIPDPPVTGQPGQFCVELQNPLAMTRTVTVDYQVADFGAGIWFTSVGTRTVTLPPESIDDYCINWTPDPGGTLHRCLQVTLIQPGYEDQHSQRNIDVVAGTILDILHLDLPLLVQNPDLGPHQLEFEIRTYGFGPGWLVEVASGDGNPPPDVINPGETLPLMLELTPAVSRRSPAQNDLPEYGFGDETRVEVDVMMDGTRVGGVAFVFDVSEDLFLPTIFRP